MRRTALSLLSLVLFCCTERGLPQYTQCDRTTCYIVFQDVKNFNSAQKSCKDVDGHLMTIPSQKAHNIVQDLLQNMSGRYWVGLQLPDGQCPSASSPLFGYQWITGDATNFGELVNYKSSCDHKCVSVSVNDSAWRQEPCSDALNGFLCEKAFDGCLNLTENAEETVDYTSVDLNFKFLTDFRIFPAGTQARRKRRNSEYFDSKFICFSGNWLQAPWQCEVEKGGCEHACNTIVPKVHSCTCPTGQVLHANSITCVEDPCAKCAHHCEDGTQVCRCLEGYELAPDKKGCEDVDECQNANICTEENTECLNTPGGFVCTCRDGYDKDDGECVNVEICNRCEHMCRKVDGVFKCQCRNGFIISKDDPVKCEEHCTEHECNATCIYDKKKPGHYACTCPDGYIHDVRNETSVCIEIENACRDYNPCDHKCVKTPGSYTCLCNEGFEMVEDTCLPTEDGSGLTTPDTGDFSPPTICVLPSYVMSGSVLGITVFIALCMTLTYLVLRYISKHCSTFEITPLKQREIDIFHLHQVKTERYKRFSIDKQCKIDCQRL